MSQLNEIIEELRSQIRELRDRVAILEIGVGEMPDAIDSSNTTSTSRPTVSDSIFLMFYDEIRYASSIKKKEKFNIFSSLCQLQLHQKLPRKKKKIMTKMQLYWPRHLLPFHLHVYLYISFIPLDNSFTLFEWAESICLFFQTSSTLNTAPPPIVNPPPPASAVETDYEEDELDSEEDYQEGDEDEDSLNRLPAASRGSPSSSTTATTTTTRSNNSTSDGIGKPLSNLLDDDEEGEDLDIINLGTRVGSDGN